MTEWTKHTGTGKPERLADAQIVEVQCRDSQAGGKRGILLDVTDRANNLGWGTEEDEGIMPIEWYRPALTEDGLPYVSAEGLEPNAEYVCVDEETGDILQCSYMPKWEGDGEDSGWVGGFTVGAPETHRIPGDPEHSLARVWRK